VTGLPAKLALLASVVLVFLLAHGAATPAAAHGIHAHHASAAGHQRPLLAQTSKEIHAVTRPDVHAHRAANTALPDTTPDNAGDCCCGSLMCHAGLTFPVALMPLPYANAQRIVPEPSSRVEERVPSGLERPPRRPDSV
jgi:hypothetical protein